MGHCILSHFDFLRTPDAGCRFRITRVWNASFTIVHSNFPNIILYIEWQLFQFQIVYPCVRLVDGIAGWPGWSASLRLVPKFSPRANSTISNQKHVLADWDQIAPMPIRPYFLIKRVFFPFSLNALLISRKQAVLLLGSALIQTTFRNADKTPPFLYTTCYKSEKLRFSKVKEYWPAFKCGLTCAWTFVNSKHL